MGNRFWMVLVVAALVGCGEASEGASNDRDSAVDEDRRVDERLPNLTGGASGASGMGGDGDGDGDAGNDAAMDDDAAIEESEPDAEVDAAEPMPVDSDGDGVPDADDACEGHDDMLDVDSDSIPDGCDACPVGLDHACDKLLWTVEIPQGNYALPEDPAAWVTIAMRIEGGDGDGLTIAAVPPINGEAFEIDVADDRLEELRGMLARSDGLTGQATIVTIVEATVKNATGPKTSCPFDPAATVLRRVRVAGKLSPYSLNLRFEFRGYQAP